MFSLHEIITEAPVIYNYISTNEISCFFFFRMKFTLVLLLPLLVGNDAARILAFLPMPSKSHQAVFQPLIRGLAERGHHVTSVTPFPLEDPPQNLKEIRVPELSHMFQGSIE